MQPVMVVVDNNVNARIICEVLLESRGEHCVLCTRGEIHECVHRLPFGGVLLLEADLRNQQHRQQLGEAVRRLREQRREVGILVVTDGDSELRQTEVDEWANDVLHATQVGAALLPKLDALRGRPDWSLTEDISSNPCTRFARAFTHRFASEHRGYFSSTRLSCGPTRGELSASAHG